MQPAVPQPRSFWLFQQPYLLLSLTSLFWAINIVMGRYVAGHVPPIALSFVRWTGACLLILPFAWHHLKRDWPAIARHLPLLVMLSLTGFSAYNALAYYGLQYTQALNALLIQSAGPLFIALWSLVLLGVRLTAAQAVGIGISLVGVLIILLHGDLETLSAITFNKGDVIFTTALISVGLYSVLTTKRPTIHPLSFLAFTTGCGAVLLIPFFAGEIATGYTLTFDTETIAMLAYVVIFPSALAYLFFNRGVELIGPNRAAPFFHLMPVFGSALAIAFLGERPHLFHAVGYALVLVGIVIAARKSSAAAGGTTPPES
jgi:drug/metabolite transporter (DMT)-like permease